MALVPDAAKPPPLPNVKLFFAAGSVSSSPAVRFCLVPLSAELLASEAVEPKPLKPPNGFAGAALSVAAAGVLEGAPKENGAGDGEPFDG